MKFQINTLIDVTDTGARRSQNVFEAKQQANFDTLYNVIGLRTNPTEFNVTVLEEDVKKYGFGSEYKGKQKIWQVEFYVEAEASTNIEFMRNDFSLVPIIAELNESVKLDKNLFISSNKSKFRNIVFVQVDK